jgi:hypothetical protein
MVQSVVDADVAFRARLRSVCAEGWAIWDRFTEDARERPFHPFVAANYDVVAEALWPYRGRGLRFLELGSATGVITVMADMLGFRAFGIELDGSLVKMASELARKFNSGARFAVGSFLPTGYCWRANDGDPRTGTIGSGLSGYLQLGHSLEEFDVVFGYPWDGEEPVMLDLVKRFGAPDALLLLNHHSDGVRAYRGGKRVAG